MKIACARRSLHALLATLLVGSTIGLIQPAVAKDTIDFRAQFMTLLEEKDPEKRAEALETIKNNWEIGLVPMSIEVMLSTRPNPTHTELLEMMRASAKETGVDPSVFEAHDWLHWLWNQEVKPVAGYSNFKAGLYKYMDPKFETYFKDRQDSARIRLDEIRWGGVRQDGIPPLRKPEMVSVEKADYLEDDNIVFGIEINGDVRAYPKRILAWHEMFTDEIGGVQIAGVYCTLCGTVIPFRTEFKGTQHELGTSGFLYRSNKLMYDRKTQSLWSTTRGEPVMGPLVDKGIKLDFESVVTTTWGEWRKRHPKTTVLSLNTGHDRPYGEGVAYAEYFGTDKLMFNTPFRDDRLANKREILALRFAAAPNQQLAIDTEFLNKNPLYKGEIGAQKFVVLTDKSGANRVYDPGDTNLTAYDQNGNATDDQGNKWGINESWLQGPDDKRLKRLPYHRAFWFGWRAAFPETRLIK